MRRSFGNRVREASVQPAPILRNGMKYIEGEVFKMGSERFYPEEAPVRSVQVDSFWIDETPVTNSAFQRFVDATGYRTTAESPPDPLLYPAMPADLAQSGSAVFGVAEDCSGPTDALQCWQFVIGADWKHPLGPESTIDGLDQHPVVHVTLADATAYSDWAGKQLPTEAEWEFAARGGLDGADYAWGNELAPDGKLLANFWQGNFPLWNSVADGWERTSPVRTYPANGYGLFDMIGNVWEWTMDWYGLPSPGRKARGACCVPRNPRGPSRGQSIEREYGTRIPRKVLKGGSHLCAANYCQRYRPAARYPQPIDTSTSHVGFRCVLRI